MLILKPFSREALKLHPFDCGEPVLNDWLAESAGQNEKKDNARTTLLLDEQADRIAGYFTMLTYRLSVAEAKSATGRDHKYPVPAMLIARLAVDVDYKEKGLGRLLLDSALRRLLAAADDVGFELVVVHALNEGAAGFYLKHGFCRFVEHDLHLFLTTKNLRATYATADSS